MVPLHVQAIGVLAAACFSHRLISARCFLVPISALLIWICCIVYRMRRCSAYPSCAAKSASSGPGKLMQQPCAALDFHATIITEPIVQAAALDKDASSLRRELCFCHWSNTAVDSDVAFSRTQKRSIKMTALLFPAFQFLYQVVQPHVGSNDCLHVWPFCPLS